MSELSGREIIIKKLSKVMLCSCIDAYKLRKLSAPDCAYCNYVDEVADWHMKEVARIIEPLEQIEEEISKLSPDKSDVEIVILMLMFCNNYIKASRETLKRARGGE